MHTRASLERFGAESMIPAGLGDRADPRDRAAHRRRCSCRAASAPGIGAELGAMKVTEQIDALEAVAVDSFKYLAVTRMIACVIALPLLTISWTSPGSLGGFVAETLVSGMSLRLYFAASFAFIDFTDFVPATLKTVVFGFIIATVSSLPRLHDDAGHRGRGPRVDARGRASRRS